MAANQVPPFIKGKKPPTEPRATPYHQKQACITAKTNGERCILDSLTDDANNDDRHHSSHEMPLLRSGNDAVGSTDDGSTLKPELCIHLSVPVGEDRNPSEQNNPP